MRRTKSETKRGLLSIAFQQQGFFTARQAVEAGYPDDSHVYHVKAGNWVRELRGVYRLADYPASERPDLVMWSLWSRDRRGEPLGVFSHQTALSIHDLSDLNPGRLHMTVPPRFRRRIEIPAVLVLHRKTLDDADTQAMEGYRVTRPLRTVVDLLEDGEVSHEVLRAALSQAIRRGLISVEEHRGAERQGLLAGLER